MNIKDLWMDMANYVWNITIDEPTFVITLENQMGSARTISMKIWTTNDSHSKRGKEGKNRAQTF